MSRFQVHGVVTISFVTEVEANSAEEAEVLVINEGVNEIDWTSEEVDVWEIYEEVGAWEIDTEVTGE